MAKSPQVVETLAQRGARMVKEWRRARGLNQAQLAALCGLPPTAQSQLSKYERLELGIHLDQLEMLSTALGVTPAQFLAGPDAEPDQPAEALPPPTAVVTVVEKLAAVALPQRAFVAYALVQAAEGNKNHWVQLIEAALNPPGRRSRTRMKSAASPQDGSTFAERLKRAMAESPAGPVSPTYLVQVSRLSKSTISLLMNGDVTNPTQKTIHAIASALGVSSTWLASGTGTMLIVQPGPAGKRAKQRTTS